MKEKVMIPKDNLPQNVLSSVRKERNVLHESDNYILVLSTSETETRLLQENYGAIPELNECA